MGLGLALGAKHADPSRTVVCTIGDGAFHYNPVVASFGAAQEHGLPLLVVLFNNAGYSSQKNDVANYYPEGRAVQAGKVIGTPELRYRFSSSSASKIRLAGESVIGLTIMPLSDRFTRSTSDACSAIERFL